MIDDCRIILRNEDYAFLIFWIKCVKNIIASTIVGRGISERIILILRISFPRVFRVEIAKQILHIVLQMRFSNV